MRSRAKALLILSCLPLLMAGTALAGEGVDVKITNDGTQDIVVTVYDTSTSPRRGRCHECPNQWLRLTAGLAERGRQRESQSIVDRDQHRPRISQMRSRRYGGGQFRLRERACGFQLRHLVRHSDVDRFTGGIRQGDVSRGSGRRRSGRCGRLRCGCGGRLRRLCRRLR